MIQIVNVTKQYPMRHGFATVLDDVNLTIKPGEKIGILGNNGAGKSTLIRLISGIEYPTQGYVKRSMSVSWPLAFAGGFQGRLTGLDNLKFICRVYGTTVDDKIDFVQDFAELGKYFKEPTETYSSGMLTRLAFAISMVIDFDCFLIDEVVAVGDSRFQQKCHDELFVKRKDRAMIFVSHHDGYIKEHCQRAAVLIQGKLHPFDDVDSALTRYHQ
jgi:capsular polysaccharide transport system ATP-binding protein